MKKNILYVDNFNNFEFFLALGLESRKVKFSLIVFSDEKYKRAKGAGINCYLISDVKLNRKSTKCMPEKKMSLILKNDRLLKFLPVFISKRILNSYAIQYKAIISEVKPSIILGEISWASEYMFYYIAHSQGIPYRHLLNLPLPKVRTVLFDAEHSMNSLLEMPTEILNSGYEISYTELCETVKSYYSTRKVHTLSNQSSDYRECKMLWVISSLQFRYSKIVYGTATKLLHNRKFKSKINNRKILYFPLHVQPEATPDYVSGEYSDQFELICNISKQLSDEFILIVKEHPSKFSPRSLLKLLKVIKNDNVLFIDSSVSGNEMLEMCHMVITVAGTSAVEAISKNKPAITFSNIYYNAFEGVFDGRDSFINNTFTEFVEKVLENDKYGDTYSQLESYGVEGFVHDPVIFPQVFDPKNLASINSLIEASVCQ